MDITVIKGFTYWHKSGLSLLVFADDRVIALAPLTHTNWMLHDLGYGTPRPPYTKVRERLLSHYNDLFGDKFKIDYSYQTVPQGTGILNYNIHPRAIKIEVTKKGEISSVFPLTQWMDRLPKMA